MPSPHRHPLSRRYKLSPKPVEFKVPAPTTPDGEQIYVGQPEELIEHKTDVVISATPFGNDELVVALRRQDEKDLHLVTPDHSGPEEVRTTLVEGLYQLVYEVNRQTGLVELILPGEDMRPQTDVAHNAHDLLASHVLGDVILHQFSPR